jgi:ubiquinone/menaquinone biosynthesis C-methylase UbiE
MRMEPEVSNEYDPVRWFDSHYHEAAGEIVEFLAGDGISLEGKALADIGSGDGVIDLGVMHKSGCTSLVGYDIRETDVSGLRRAAGAAGISDLPAGLAFVQSSATEVPAVDDSFDAVFTWSTFEHVSNPIRMLSEIRRILRPDGVFFLQLWPFYLSEHGGHLWRHYDETFPHIVHSDAEIADEIKGKRGTDPTREADDEYDSLNRLTLDGLQMALVAAGFVTTKLKLMTATLHVRPEIRHLRFADIGVGGIELLAVPR